MIKACELPAFLIECICQAYTMWNVKCRLLTDWTSQKIDINWQNNWKYGSLRNIEPQEGKPQNMSKIFEFDSLADQQIMQAYERRFN